MKRTALIAALVSLIPLAASAVSANAEPRYGRHATPYRGVAPVMPYFHRPRPHVERYHFRRDWHPRAHWRMPRLTRPWR